MATAGCDKVDECHLVTGGGGYAGYCLGRKLVEAGIKVVLFDVCSPKWPLLDGMDFIKADVRNMDDLKHAFSGITCVYHLASFGMSGREQLNKDLIEAVNIQGTRNIIEACIINNVTSLVYTSTYNVVFGGQEIKNGDESLPYLPLDKHPDHYSRTKAIAEMKVLASDGQQTADGKILHTCALRLAGVYGPDEQRHLPRIVSYLQRGLFLFVYGHRTSLVDFLHVDNLVQAHILAGRALSASNPLSAAGQVYFISDSKPINNFEFFKPLVQSLGYTYPSIRLPLWIVYYIAFITEVAHRVVGRVYNFQPFLTCTEVYKTGVTHYFSTLKAERELGYKPEKQNDMTEIIKAYKLKGCMKTQQKSSTFFYFLVNILLAFVFAIIIMSFLPLVK